MVINKTSKSPLHHQIVEIARSKEGVAKITWNKIHFENRLHFCSGEK